MKRPSTLLGAALGFVFAAGLAISADTPPSPVPADREVADAEKLVRDVHKAEYAKKKPTDQVELARKLLKEGRETTDSQPVKFVLFREARDLAARGGDLHLAMEAVDETTRAFAVKSLDQTWAVLSAAEKARTAPARSVAEAALDVVDTAVQADDYPAADRLLKLATGASNRVEGGAALAGLVWTRTKEVAAIQKGFVATEADRKTLLRNPSDQGANARVGRFLCLLKGDWQMGLPLLAVGDDEKLKAVADLDLTRPGKVDEKVTLADKWWDLGEGLGALERTRVRGRAYFWYQEAMPDLTGLSKARVEKRLAEIEKAEPRLARAGTGWTVLFRSADASLWNTATNRGRDLFAIPLDKAPQGVKFLKLAEMKNGSSAIIEMTQARLAKASEQDEIGWAGNNELDSGGYHLGIYRTDWRVRNRGDIAVRGGRLDRGWGFGHVHFGNGGQGYSWNGEIIEKTVIEIAVKTTPLTFEESRHLLKKK